MVSRSRLILDGSLAGKRDGANFGQRPTPGDGVRPNQSASSSIPAKAFLQHFVNSPIDNQHASDCLVRKCAITGVLLPQEAGENRPGFGQSMA